jgi:hypothetical protein
VEKIGIKSWIVLLFGVWHHCCPMMGYESSAVQSHSRVASLDASNPVGRVGDVKPTATIGVVFIHGIGGDPFAT